MPQETLGYVKLEWTCPKCGSRNPGPEKACLSCGAPQPQDVQFERPASQELVKDEAEIKQAKAGPDIHCAFCGARNPAGATVCSQCGADLKEGTRREAGKVVGAYQVGPVKQIPCPNCGTPNPETALKCANCGASLTRPAEPAPAAPSSLAAKPARPKWMVYGLIGAAIALCLCAVIGYALLSTPRESQTAAVQTVNWETGVAIEEQRPVTHQTWQDQIPQDADVGDCQDEVRYVQDQQPVGGNYNKVCGTPYTKDTGGGYGEVVQDCRYEVLEPYCSYSMLEWQQLDVARLSGDNLLPVWPEPQLSSDQRLGQQSATYVVIFETKKGKYSYPVNSLEEFQQFQIGSRWTLNINSLNQIVSVEPAQ